MQGWIKLHRSLLEWEWYDDINATRLLIHLLISVNYVDKKWRGVNVKAGSMILSWASLSEGCGLSVQQARSAMSKLEDCGEVTRETTNKYQVVSLVKWDKLQGEEFDNNKQFNRQITGKQQTNNNQATTTKESKEYKESKERKNTLGENFSKNSSSAYELIKSEKQVLLESFEMKKKKLVDDWDKLLEAFEIKIEFQISKNEVEWISDQLFARFKSFVNAWIDNRQKDQSKNNNQPANSAKPEYF